ncbi:LysR family transcriptional regulator [Vibrio crassostreae]|nr:LysR family transcriptional regulator [Vibrio crassostreae]CAK1709498.1 putative Transcriptional regulator, LysR family protein [Vibrio crassostreae]CAK1727036.1 putative Transcriptional regulator, LysR family protein [Vibrio crassostreae]CAK1746322.1 putative Transcriptional regulator, LysR family protein [Vibrio crassostreae]CAK1748047.1 putative Transcriptional regulator, LysR family protein [Vibrio crassostreae]CAK1755331.1 putative Transcriptional regulator, LysR family protein [Vibrio
MMFTLEQIHCFNQVYVTHSYSQAGRILGKTRTTVREQVVALEDSTGLVLFQLEGKRLTPTQAADAIYERTVYLAKHARDLRETLLSLHDSARTELVICYDSLVPMALLTNIHVAISEQFPHLNVQFLDRVREHAFVEVKQGIAHIALMASENLLATSHELDVINLGTMQFSAYLSHQHPLAKAASVSLNELRLVKQYMTESAARGGLGAYPMSVNKQIITDTNLLLEMAAKDGWTIIPEWLANSQVTQKGLIKLDLEEVLQSQPHNLCAFFPIHYRSDEQLREVANIVCQLSKQYLA